MKIKVKDLRPNPFRDLKICPIDYDKVSRLGKSIEENDFWDNLICRKEEDDTFSLAYGYHRYLALKDLGWEEVDIPVKPLTDAEMIRIMGAENREWYGNNSKMIIETVSVAKKFIEDEINSKDAVYDDLEDWCKALFNDEKAFIQSMNANWLGHVSQPRKVGKKVISRFLGESWNEKTITRALPYEEGSITVSDKMKDPDTEEEIIVKRTIPLSKNAGEMMPTIAHASEFKKTVQNDEASRIAFTSEKAQENVVEEILKENPSISSRGLSEKVHEKAIERLNSSKEESASYGEDIKEEFLSKTGTTPTSRSKSIHKEFPRVFEKMKIATKELADTYSRLKKDCHPHMKTFIDPTRQSVLTSQQSKAILNTLYEMEFFIQSYRRNFEALTNETPDKDCIQYGCYPSIFDFDENLLTDIWENADNDIVEVDVNDFLAGVGIYAKYNDEEDTTETWLKDWLIGKTDSIDDND